MSAPRPIDRHLTLAEAAERSGHGPRTLQREIKAGRLVGLNPTGRRLVIAESALDAWLHTTRHNRKAA